MQVSERAEIPELFELRRLLMEDALNDSFKDGHPPNRKGDGNEYLYVSCQQNPREID
jgi:hypothetical protein